MDFARFDLWKDQGNKLTSKIIYPNICTKFFSLAMLGAVASICAPEKNQVPHVCLGNCIINVLFESG